MKIIILSFSVFLLAACSPTKPKYKVGQCFGGGKWEKLEGGSSNLGETVYHKVEKISLEKGNYMLGLYSIESSEHYGSFAWTISKVNEKFEPIPCPFN